MPEEREQSRQLVTEVKHRASDKLRDIWWWFMIRGVLALGMAVVALFWPQMTVSILVKLLGTYFLFDGLIGAIAAFRAGGKGGFPAFALVSFVFGTILLLWTGISVRVFLTLAGAWALLQGAGMFLSNRGNDSDAEARKLSGIVGAVLAVIGVILIIWPTTGIVAISWLIAGVALLLGCVLLFLATRLRRLTNRIDRNE